MGKVTIETHAVTIDEDDCVEHPSVFFGEYVVLLVRDNGSGMDKDTLDKLFEPFFTTKEMGKGTGLGLATIYGIVKQNNGFINVDSEPGQGTTFKIYFPSHKGGIEKRTKEVPVAPLCGNETILLVEDAQAILTMTTTMLQRLDYTVLTASSPDDAIRIAKKHAGEIHLLITDVVMPEMNGQDLANKMSSLYPRLKILFMSGYPANVIAHHGVLGESIDFIQKPFSMRKLAAKLREMLEKK
jgi:CheY-like chemotaxis protein